MARLPWEGPAFAASMLACALLVLANPYPRGDLENTYGDHVRNVFSAWAFFHEGPRVFWEPLGELGPRVPARVRHLGWPTDPVVYPAGMVILFAPLAVAQNVFGATTEVVGRWAILAALAAAHLALFAYVRGLREAGHPWPIQWLLTYWFYSLFIVFTLNGEYDAAYLLPLILAFDSLRAGKPERTCLLYSIALFVHYRPIAFLPIFAASFLEWAGMRRGRSPGRDPSEAGGPPRADGGAEGIAAIGLARRTGFLPVFVSVSLVLASLASLALTFPSLQRMDVQNATFSLDGVPRIGALILAAASVTCAILFWMVGRPLLGLQIAVLGGFFLVSRSVMLWHLLILFPLALFPLPKGLARAPYSLFFAGWTFLVFNLIDHPPDIHILKDRIVWMLEDSCAGAARIDRHCSLLGMNPPRNPSHSP